MSTLPSLPSALIRLALSDLSKCESDPRYTIDMLTWHEHIDGTCFVCLAGAVMAQTLSIPHYRFATPIHKELYALNEFRRGRIKAGLMFLHIVRSDMPLSISIPKYADDPAAFHTAMHKLADLFEAHNL